MMKKAYMKPTAEVIRIETASMVAISNPQVSGTTNQESDLLGRDFDYDDDDEE